MGGVMTATSIVYFTPDGIVLPIRTGILAFAILIGAISMFATGALLGETLIRLSRWNRE